MWIVATYLLIGVPVIVWVGLDLFKNGLPLIVNLYQDIELSKTINKLLLVGYYLVNIGYLAITVHIPREAIPISTGLEIIAEKLGLILLILGILHLNNILVLNVLSKYKNQFKTYIKP
jgi:hypothetical protein